LVVLFTANIGSAIYVVEISLDTIAIYLANTIPVVEINIMEKIIKPKYIFLFIFVPF